MRKKVLAVIVTATDVILWVDAIRKYRHKETQTVKIEN